MLFPLHIPISDSFHRARHFFDCRSGSLRQMSLTAALASQAETAFTHKNWKKSCLHYDQYFTRAYPQPNAEISDRDIILLVHYARSLFRNLETEDEGGKKLMTEMRSRLSPNMHSRRRSVSKRPLLALLHRPINLTLINFWAKWRS
jgi:hypothetical protein